MKFIHLADLHIGKRVNAFPMLEDQRYILKQILTILREEQPDGGVILAGDIYDKAIPSAEAVELFDEFLTQLAALRLRVFIIAGNHDSPERIAFGNRLMDRSGIYLSPVYDGHVKRITCPDSAASVTLSAANAVDPNAGTRPVTSASVTLSAANAVDLNAGTHSVESAPTSVAASTCPPVDVYLLPFLKPASVRRFYPEESIESYTDAMRVAIAHMDIDPTHRNLLVTHQFVTGASRSDSEDISVGGSDNVDASVFAPFDYVALGHLHGPQQLRFQPASDVHAIKQDVTADVVAKSVENATTDPVIRYAGTPLKYSFSEARHHKSVTVVEIGEKKADGVVDVCIGTRELRPLHDMREIRGSYEELTLRANYEGTATDDYIHATLTDEIEVPDAARHLQVIYPNLMKLDYDNARTRGQGSERLELEQLEEKSPLDLFSELFEKQNHKEMTEEQARYVQAQMEKIWEA